MDKRIIKTFLVLLSMSTTALLLPIFTQWYCQKTGIYPWGAILLMSFFGFIFSIIVVLKIWGEIK
jgi:hypothetical protein